MRVMFLETETPEELQYGSCLAKRREYGIHVRDPYPETAVSAIGQYSPDVIWWIGHGSPEVTTLRDKRVFVSTRTPEDVIKRLFGGRVVVAVSCYTARELGPYVAKYAFAYFGARDAYYFIITPAGPCPQTTVSGVRYEVLYNASVCAFEPTLVLVDALHGGYHPVDAYKVCREKFEEYMQYFNSLTPVSDYEKSLKNLALYILHIDYNIWVMIQGQGRPQVRLVEPLTVLPAVFSFGMMLSAFAYPKTEKGG